MKLAFTGGQPAVVSAMKSATGKCHTLIEAETESTQPWSVVAISWALLTPAPKVEAGFMEFELDPFEKFHW